MTDIVLRFRPRAYRGGFWIAELEEPITYQNWTIPKGFQSDLESYPWFVRWLTPRAGRALRASIIHDYLSPLIGRKDANRVMNDIMREDGVRGSRRMVISMGSKSGALCSETKQRKLIWQKPRKAVSGKTVTNA